MNTDRFLTRVFDKQEKKMLYSEDTFNYNNTVCVFKAIGDGCLYYAVSCQSGTTRWNELYAIRLGEYSQCKDRFVPMMCEASKDKNGKLLYEEDIFLRFDYDRERHMFICKYKDSTLTAFSIEKKAGVIIPVCSAYGVGIGRSEIIGNIHENEELLEVKA